MHGSTTQYGGYLLAKNLRATGHYRKKGNKAVIITLLPALLACNTYVA